MRASKCIACPRCTTTKKGRSHARVILQIKSLWPQPYILRSRPQLHFGVSEASELQEPSLRTGGGAWGLVPSFLKDLWHRSLFLLKGSVAQVPYPS